MIQLTTEQIERAQRMLSHIPDASPKAIVRAVNRSAEAARAELSRKLRETYYIKHADITNATKIKPASVDQKRFSATVKVRGTRRELSQFRVSPKTPNPKNPPKRIRVAVKKSGLKPLPGAFVNRGMSSGLFHVMKRVGKARYPVHIKYGPSIPEMAGNPEVTAAVEQRAQEMLERRLDHEITRILEANR
jgi:hypothetical protein